LTLLKNSLFIIKKKKKKNFLKTEMNPFKKGSISRVFTLTPRKPNSARRSVVKANLSNFKKTLAYIPGIGHNLKKYASVLIRGVGGRDIPMVNYSCIRNKFDLNSVQNRFSRRSVYGIKKNLLYFYKKKKFFRL
jgi:small subunit ribosomal protein S12